MIKTCAAIARICAMGVFMALAGAAFAQQAYPSKPIRIIIPFPPGGSTDPLARLVGQKLTASWSQPVIVDHRPGGDSVVGSEALMKSAPDGYALMLQAATILIVSSLYQNPPYDAIRDFAPVATLISTEFMLEVNASVPANNLQEFIALAKAKPGQLNYASVGAGSATRLAGELFCIMTGVKMQNVPYKGSGQALTDLIGGQVQLSFAIPFPSIPHIRSGKLRAIAITGKNRSPALPEVPTFAEAGLPDFQVNSWYGFFAPPATPRGVIDKLASEIAKILAMPEIREKIVSQGMEPFISTPDEFAVLMKADFAKFANIVKTANIKLER